LNNPEQPNGIVIGYKVKIIPEGRIIDVQTVANVTIDSLKPYTIYNVSAAACTSAGCTWSPITAVLTLSSGLLVFTTLNKLIKGVVDNVDNVVSFFLFFVLFC
jgi:hypothetical protein